MPCPALRCELGVEINVQSVGMIEHLQVVQDGGIWKNIFYGDELSPAGMANNEIGDPVLVSQLIHDDSNGLCPQQLAEAVFRPGVLRVGCAADQLVVADELPWGLFGRLRSSDRDDVVSSFVQREPQVPHLPREVLMNEEYLHELSDPGLNMGRL